MKNKMSDLNNHLFMALERLNDESLTPDELGREIERARAISGIATSIIANNALVLKASIAQADALNADYKQPLLLGDYNQ